MWNIELKVLYNDDFCVYIVKTIRKIKIIVEKCCCREYRNVDKLHSEENQMLPVNTMS